MQSVTPQFLRALQLSHTPIDQVEVWRGGQLLKSGNDLQVQDGKISVSGGDGQVIRTTVNLTIIDPDGKLVPNKMDDPLAPFGSEVRIKMGIRLGTKNELLVMGWFPIISLNITEFNDSRTKIGKPDSTIWFSKGAIIELEASDRMYNLEGDKFTSRVQPRYTSVLGEVRRLLDAKLPPYGGVTGSVPDATVPSDLTYDTDRLKAILSLAEILDADPYIAPNGSFRLLSRIRNGSVWRLEKGEFSVLRNTKRRISREGVYNGATETSTADNDRPLMARKVVTSGPLRWGGPFGRVPFLHTSPLLTTQAQVNAAVNTVYTRATTLAPQAFGVECVRNPALQWGDQIELPTRTGYVLCTITAITYPLGVENMNLTLTADPFALRGLI